MAKNIIHIFGEYKVSVPACEGLTASICQDNVTCTGKDACTDAKVGTIHLGCNGFEACKEAGKGGYIGTINNGCEGRSACTKTGYRGNVTLIQNSCRALNAFNYIGARACAFAASDGGDSMLIHDGTWHRFLLEKQNKNEYMLMKSRYLPLSVACPIHSHFIL